MRLSIDKRDPGFSHRNVGLKARIYLDSVEQTHCVTADEEESLIVKYKIGEDGKPVADLVAEAWVLETVRGKVLIDLLGPDGESLKTPQISVERRGHDGAIEVYVYSRVRPMASKRRTIEVVDQPSDHSRLEALVALTAAAVGAMNCEQYGDYYDPSECARMAGERLREMLGAERTLASQTRH